MLCVPIFLQSLIYLLCVGSCHRASVAVRGQLVGLGLRPPSGLQGSNSGWQAWWPAPLPNEPSRGPSILIFILRMVFPKLSVHPLSGSLRLSP